MTFKNILKIHYIVFNKYLSVRGFCMKDYIKERVLMLAEYIINSSDTVRGAAKKFNVSILTTETPFEVFRHFGFQSGADNEKFFKNPNETRSDNGVLYLTGCTNGYFSGAVVEEVDMGTHTMFIAEITQSEALSDAESLTYAYYHANVKPKPQPKEEKKGWRCKICGYVYEGEELPEDYVCPVCKHGREDFEKIL